MVCKPLEMVDIFAESKVQIGGVMLEWIIPVARVITTSFVAVFRPVAFAKPAKFVEAYFTDHMHASFIFLDVHFTIWATLRVLRKPKSILSFFTRSH